MYKRQAWKSNDEKYTFEEYVQGKVAFYQDVTFIAQYKELAYVTIQYSITDKDGKPIVDEEGNVLSVGKLSLETEQVNPVIGQPAGSKVVYLSLIHISLIDNTFFLFHKGKAIFNCTVF